MRRKITYLMISFLMFTSTVSSPTFGLDTNNYIAEKVTIDHSKYPDEWFDFQERYSFYDNSRLGGFIAHDGYHINISGYITADGTYHGSYVHTHRISDDYHYFTPSPYTDSSTGGEFASMILLNDSEIYIYSPGRESSVIYNFRTNTVRTLDEDGPERMDNGKAYDPVNNVIYSLYHDGENYQKHIRKFSLSTNTWSTVGYLYHGDYRDILEEVFYTNNTLYVLYKDGGSRRTYLLTIDKNNASVLEQREVTGLYNIWGYHKQFEANGKFLMTGHKSSAEDSAYWLDVANATATPIDIYKGNGVNNNNTSLYMSLDTTTNIIYQYNAAGNNHSDYYWKYYPNTAPANSITSPSSMHVSNSQTFSFSARDIENQTLSHVVTMGTSSGGTNLYNKTLSGNSGNSFNLDLSNLSFSWNSSTGRYESKIYMKVATSDGYDVTTTTKTITVYNYIPSGTITTSATTYKIHKGDSFTLSMKVWDPNKDYVTAVATLGSYTKTIGLTPPSSSPSSSNVNFVFDSLAEGTYTGAKVVLTDQYGHSKTINSSLSVVVKDVIGFFEENTEFTMGVKEKDSLSVSLVSDIGIPETSTNKSTASDINGSIQNRGASQQNILLTENHDIFSGQDITYTTGYADNILSSISGEWYALAEVYADAYIPGEDINYEALFTDVENDYETLTAAQKIGGAISADQQKWKDGSLIYKLEHDPSVFDDPAPIHTLHQSTYTSLADMESSLLVREATTDKRGLWKLYAMTKDDSGNGSYDKYSNESVTNFYDHLPPVAAAFHNETASSLSLYGIKAYDPDTYIRREDKGIPEGNYTWRFMTADGKWYDHAGTTSEETINRTYNSQNVTRYSQTVEDFLGATDTTYRDINFDLSMTVTIDKAKPYQLEDGETFNVTAAVTTDQNITEMTTWVDEFEGNTKNMNYQGKAGQTSTYNQNFTVTSSFEEKDYLVFVRCKTLEGSDETRVGIITILNNVPPEHIAFNISPLVPYTGDDVIGTFTVNDDDDQDLIHDVTVEKDGSVVNTISHTVSPSGTTYAPFDLNLVNAADHGNYTVTSTLTDPYGAKEVKVYTFEVKKFIISGTMEPSDPMAGDELIWNIHSEGGIDRFELILDSEIISTDERDTMGYAKVTYPLTWSVNGGTDIKDTRLDYILWCTTTQSVTLKGVRNRAAYDFTIRAYIGTEYRDLTFTREVSGDVRELIKTGYKTQ